MSETRRFVSLPNGTLPTRIAGIRPVSRLSGPAMLAMLRDGVFGTGVADQDYFLLHAVAALAERLARVDGVAVVETAADGV